MSSLRISFKTSCTTSLIRRECCCDLTFFQQQSQAADYFAGAFVFAYDFIKNFPYLAEVGLAIRENPLCSLRVTENGAERRLSSCAIEPESSPSIVTRERCAIWLRLTRGLQFGPLALGNVE